ncbi:FAD-dependent oxidoreductase [Novipirellula rosea]
MLDRYTITKILATVTTFSLTFLSLTVVSAQDILVEAESFEEHGGWKLDTQFIREMGSPYLLAHGLGRPVNDATTTVEFPEAGEYHVWVRTKDWVARWNAEGQPGRFQVVVDGQPLGETFGTNGAEWFWQDGGTVTVSDEQPVKVALHDLTGFDGRCDAILFSKSNTPPPNTSDILPTWRRQRLGLKEQPTEKPDYDLVVIGGGYAGMASAISAARMGCKVALIQDRPVLGGNGSSEIRVWAMGNIRRGKYTRIGEIVEEFCDRATKSPGTYEEFEDAKKERIVRAEKNIDLFLNHHAYQVDTEGDMLRSVSAFNTKTSEQLKFSGRLFADCTGHGTIGYLAKADWDMTPDGRMGMSNMWAWDEAEEPRSFPETPWALDLEMADFPYPRDHHGQWFWESGFDKDPLGDAEGIRDWNLRAVYGAFNAMKNRDGAADHKTAYLTWIAYIGGPRESRRLLGDVVLTKEDIIAKRDFKDGCVPSTWSIDLHYGKEEYAKKFPDNPFISIAVHDKRVDRSYGYPVPYRCFYSRNIDNLFMAGRNISVTHEALGTTRVMKTCGMMGEVVGKAASLCVLHNTSPRDIYENYWSELDGLLKLPGKAYRESVSERIVIPEGSMKQATDVGKVPGIDPGSLVGIVIDDVDAEMEGRWFEGVGIQGFVGLGYRFTKADKPASMVFRTKIEEPGRYDVRLAYQPHASHSDRVPVVIQAGGQTLKVWLNMKKATKPEPFQSLGEFDVRAGEPISVTLANEGVKGSVYADAVQIVVVDAKENTSQEQGN